MTSNQYFNYTTSINYRQVLSNPSIKDLYQKCQKYKNNVFNTSQAYNYKTVYSIGDVHGDFKALIQILYAINSIVYKNNTIHWNPQLKDTCIIQVGDIMDGYKLKVQKYPFYTSQDFKIIKLLLDLNDEAIKYNSRIILLYGNHEIFNLFKLLDKIKLYDYRNSIKNNTLIEAQEYLRRIQYFKDKIMCNYHSFCIVNNYVFCHSGIVLKYIKKLLEIYKIDFKNFINLQVNDKIFLINICIVSMINYILSGKLNKQYIDILRTLITNIFYHNDYINISYNVKKLSESAKFKLAKDVMKNNLLLNTKGMIIGHHTTYNYQINNINSLWGIDVKLSERYGKELINDIYQILKISGNNKPEIINIRNKFKNREVINNKVNGGKISEIKQNSKSANRSNSEKLVNKSSFNKTSDKQVNKLSSNKLNSNKK